MEDKIREYTYKMILIHFHNLMTKNLKFPNKS